MIISTVSKSHEGFYSANTRERRVTQELDLSHSVSFRISDLCPPHTQFCTGSVSISARDSRADFQMLQDE
ncbi:hypothetical protein cypCar_00046416, partial [Cyprinus carpio]